MTEASVKEINAVFPKCEIPSANVKENARIESGRPKHHIRIPCPFMAYSGDQG